jgi:hypothetical protein
MKSVWQQILLRLSVLGCGAVIFMFLAAAPTAPESVQNKTSCKATYPAKGKYAAAFYDMIDGGTCWSCPKGYKRTAASVKAKNACVGFKKATYKGKYGCKRKYGGGAFYDPRKGGECWTCPRGYKRTLEAVTSGKACSKGVFGPFSRATRKGKSGCNSGFKDPIDGGTCWSCPRGAKRTVFSVKSNKACEVPTKAQLQGKYLGGKKMSAAGKRKLKNLSQQFSNKNSGIMKELNGLYKLLNGKLAGAFRGKALENAVKTGNYNAVWSKIDQDMKPILRKIRKLERETYTSLRDFTVLSISVSAEGSAFVGGSVEQGILIYFNDINNIKVRGFTEYGATVTTSVGIGVGVSVGIWRASETDCGAGFGVSVSVGIGKIAEVGGTIGINPTFPCSGSWEDAVTLRAIDGFAISVSAGVGVPLSPVNISASFSSQMIWNGKLRRDCQPCGGRGQEACSVTERFPSCNTGLIEKCGVCR